MQRGSLDALAARHGLKITFDGKQHHLVDRDTGNVPGATGIDEIARYLQALDRMRRKPS